MSNTNVVKFHIDPTYKGISLIPTIRKDPLAYFLNLGIKNGSYTWLSLMGSPVLFLNDATAIEYILSRNDKNYHKSKYNEGLAPLLGTGIFFSEGELWRKQRRDTAPVFSGGNFPDFTQRIAEATEAMLKRWESAAATGKPIDMMEETMRLTLDVVLRALFHEGSEAALCNMRGILGTMLRMAEDRIWSIGNLPLRLILMLPKYSRTLRFLNELTTDLVSRRKANKAYPEDLLSRLIDVHADTAKDKKLLHDNIISFLTAGHETTANALTWAFYELGIHTEIRNKLISEVDDVTEGNTPDMEMVKKLQYTRQVINETLRLYPPVWTISRRVLQNDVIPLEDGRTLEVPKDATVMLCAYSVQRREKYWDDPESFTPEHFSIAEINKRPKFSWFPFGGGARLCLGFKFAEVESLIAISMVYQKYNLKLIPGQKIEPQPMITLRPDRPVLFRVTSRVGSNIEMSAPLLAGETSSAGCPMRRQG